MSTPLPKSNEHESGSFTLVRSSPQARQLMLMLSDKQMSKSGPNGADRQLLHTWNLALLPRPHRNPALETEQASVLGRHPPQLQPQVSHSLPNNCSLVSFPQFLNKSILSTVFENFIFKWIVPQCDGFHLQNIYIFNSFQSQWTGQTAHWESGGLDRVGVTHKKCGRQMATWN